MLLTLMLGLRNLIQEILQLPSDYTCLNIHKLPVLSSPPLLRHKMYIPLHTRAWHLHRVWVGFPSYTSTILDAPFIVRILGDQAARSSITLLTFLVQKRRQLHLEGARHLLLLSTRVV